MPDDLFETALSRQLWDTRYRYRGDGAPPDACIEDTWRRVADALGAAERRDQAACARQFRALLSGFQFLPGGRILAGAGTALDVTLFNCFVMGRIDDSIDGIFQSLKEGAVTMQQGGGVGYDFSTLRPMGQPAWRVGGVASGPVSFMRIWDSMCATLLSTASRRGAMMATLRCDHPDIEAFVDAKRNPRELRHFNLSVLVSDAFMEAVRADRLWMLSFSAQGKAADNARGAAGPADPSSLSGGGELSGVVTRQVPARALWGRIMRANYDSAEPGVLFIDRINRDNNLYYREEISATNPCGEIPLPPYGACNLGSLNLVCFVREPFTPRAVVDLDALRNAATTAVRLLDDVVDASRFPLPMQAEQARGSRRIGLGITGLADALIMLGLHYGSDAGRETAGRIMRSIRDAAYRASIALAKERGTFPFFDVDAYLAGPFIRSLPDDIRDGIARHGIRNSHLTAIAPTGTISLLANNVSSGIEPVFRFAYRRLVRGAAGDYAWHDLEDYALRHRRRKHGDAALAAYFVAAHDLSPRDHLAMQAVLQPFVDNAISKTINVPEDFDFESFASLYQEAYDLGLKGCTTYRSNPIRGSILAERAGETAREPNLQETSMPDAHCCGLDREND